MESCSRTELLKKWREEKLLKKQQEIKHKKPPFRCGVIASKPPPFLFQHDDESSKKMVVKQTKNVYRTENKALKVRNTCDKIRKPQAKPPVPIVVKQIDGKLSENICGQSDKRKTLGKSLPSKTVSRTCREKIPLPKESTPYHPAKHEMLWDLESIKNLSIVEAPHTSSAVKGQVISTPHPSGLR